LSQPDLEPDEVQVLGRYRVARASAFSCLEIVIRAEIHDAVLVQINTTTKERPIGLGKRILKEVSHADAA